jgi:methylmalonyl-CoA mutase
MSSLFSEFKPASAADWKNQLVKDLKGESPDTLIWHNENGFEVAPFYSAEDLKGTPLPAFIHNDWEICVKTKGTFAAEKNKQLLLDLNRGATAFSTTVAVEDLELLLSEIQLQHINSTFIEEAKDIPRLLTYLKSRQYLPAVNSTFIPQTLTNLNDLNVWCSEFAECGNNERLRFVSANTLPFHLEGALPYYEVAILCSLLNEFLGYFAGKKTWPAAPFVVKTGVTCDFFVQIAKLRSIRRLWEILKSEYSISNELHVIVETSLTNKTISDNYNNLLRSTVEAMAAVAGGCNELVVNEFDYLFPENKTLSGRMAINQQLILKEESYLNKMADVGCGSYYIENLTDRIAEKAFEMFKSFEMHGGYFSCLGLNIFSKAISKQSAQKLAEFQAGKMNVIGVNKYRNEKAAFNLSAEAREYISRLPISNPSLQYELDNVLVK